MHAKAALKRAKFLCSGSKGSNANGLIRKAYLFVAFFSNDDEREREIRSPPAMDAICHVTRRQIACMRWM